jgi:hypothetical protein
MAPHFVQYLVIFLISPTGRVHRADRINPMHDHETRVKLEV